MEIDIFTQSKIDADFIRSITTGLNDIADNGNLNQDLKVSIIINADASKPAVLNEIINILAIYPGEHSVNILEPALLQEILF